MSDERLQLVRELSRSGIATVWEGFDQQLGRKVLVKSIHPQFAREADLRIRFEREARAIARLSHPNVVQIYDIRAGEESLSLLLEFVEGETLGHLLKRRGALPFSLALKVMVEILAGLEQAHANNIVHRDLKPENILLSSAGLVKITDFGLASLRDLPGVTMDGAVLGTPAYMSPEQALGGEMGPQTDIFASGALFFEMLTGRRLITGESLGEAFQNVLKYRTVDLSQYESAVPPSVRKLLQSMIERDPTDRPQSADLVRRELLRLDESKSIAADLASYLAGTERSDSLPLVEKRSKKMLLWYSAAGVLLVLTAGALIFSTKRGDLTQIVPADSVGVTDRITELTEDSILSAESPLPIDTSAMDTSTVRPQDVPRETVQVERPATPPVPVPAGPAFVTITSTPWARVFYNDSLLGTTPLSSPVELKAGSGTFLFLNDQIGLPVSRQINLSSGETTDVALNLQDFVARLKIASVRPWADVYVDGELKFRTPSTQILFLPLGPHKIELRHPNYPYYTKDLVFEAGDPLYEVKVDLSQL